MTYADLDAQVRAATASLKAFGIRPGDNVAILLPNCPQHLIAFYAITRLGATVVEHNPLYTAHELEVSRGTVQHSRVIGQVVDRTLKASSSWFAPVDIMVTFWRGVSLPSIIRL